jgi:hypothetical protein
VREKIILPAVQKKDHSTCSAQTTGRIQQMYQGYLDANTTTNAELFRDEGKLGCRIDFDRRNASLHDELLNYVPDRTQ